MASCDRYESGFAFVLLRIGRTDILKRMRDLSKWVLMFCLSGLGHTSAADGVLESIARNLDTLQSQLTPDLRQQAGFRGLYAIKPENPNAQFLFAAPGMISTATPEWSHHGDLLAFDAVPTVDDLNQSQIGVYAADGPFKGKSVMLGYGNVPSWSPDDRHITFLLNPGNPMGAPGGIWMMKADGSDRRWLCDGSYPRWSPNGEEIMFRDFEHEPNRLGFYNLKTGTVRYILGSDVGVEFGGGTWSSDSKRVYFIAIKDERRHLASIEVSGNPETLQIIYTETRPDHELVGPPAVSPNGEKIVFAIQDRTRRTGQDRLWLNTFLHWLPLADSTAKPTLLEAHKIGLINRGMMWSRDGETIVFSSER
jgi:hypothetical protein